MLLRACGVRAVVVAAPALPAAVVTCGNAMSADSAWTGAVPQCAGDSGRLTFRTEGSRRSRGRISSALEPLWQEFNPCSPPSKGASLAWALKHRLHTLGAVRPAPGRAFRPGPADRPTSPSARELAPNPRGARRGDPPRLLVIPLERPAKGNCRIGS